MGIEVYTFAYESLVSLEFPRQFFSDLTEERCRPKFHISGIDMTVPELLNLLVPPKKRRLQHTLPLLEEAQKLQV